MVNVWQVLEFQGRNAAWLARQLDVSEAQVSRLRNGERRWQTAAKARAAEVLGVPVALLFPQEDGDGVGCADAAGDSVTAG